MSKLKPNQSDTQYIGKRISREQNSMKYELLYISIVPDIKQDLVILNISPSNETGSLSQIYIVITRGSANLLLIAQCFY